MVVKYIAGCSVTNPSITYIPRWGFAEIGAPPNHPLIAGVFHYKPSIWGFPMYGKSHIAW